MSTVNCEALVTVVLLVRSEPFHITPAPDTNPLPVTLRVNVEEPVFFVAGDILPITGVTDAAGVAEYPAVTILAALMVTVHMELLVPLTESQPVQEAKALPAAVAGAVSLTEVLGL